MGQTQSQQQQIKIGEAQLFPIPPENIPNSVFYSTLVAIVCPVPNSTIKIYGSGILLSRNIVLTVAHNLAPEQYTLDKKDFRIYVGADGSKFYKAEDWRYQSRFKNLKGDRRLELDYALIRLSEDVVLPQHHNKFLTLSLPCDCILKKNPQAEINIFGFPHLNDSYDKNHFPMNQDGTKIRLSLYGLRKKNAVIDANPQKLIMEYSISTELGQSGCPVVFEEKIIAIHRAGDKVKKLNVGRLITKDALENVKRWNESLKGDSITIKQEEMCLRCATIEYAQGLFSKARQHQDEYKYGVALQIYQQCLLIRERINGKESIETADVLHQIGLVYYYQRDYAKALEYYSLALGIYERVKGKGSFESANTLNNMGIVYDDQCDYSKALEYYSLALGIYERVKGKGSFESANTLNNMGNFYKDQRNYAKALEYYSLALGIKERVKGKGSFESANTLNNMGSVYNDQCDYAKALEYYSLALRIYERVKGKGCFESANTLNNMGIVYYNQRDYAKALESFNLALGIYQRVKGKGCLQSANTFNNMGMVYDDQRDYSKALEYYGLALEIYERVKGKGCFESANTLNNMGSVYDNQRDYPKALECYKEAQSIYEKFNIKERGYGNTLFNMGNTYSKLKDFEAAAEAYGSSLKVYERLNVQDKVNSALQLAKCLKILKRHQELQLITSKYGLGNKV